jgi:serine/threonine-protein kinase RsbW
MLLNKEIKINSSFTELYKVEAFVETISDAFNINNNYYSTILISLDEAVRNAIEHGNKNDSNKEVKVSVENSKGELIFSVQDEGEGFQMPLTNDATDILDTYKDGKGLFLMKSLSDNLSLNEVGNKVSLHFKVSSINNELAMQRVSALNAYFQEQKISIKA